MKIAVAEKHIRLGSPCEAQGCPIAHAIREAVPGLTYVAVSRTFVRYSWTPTGEVPTDVRAPLPPAATHFVERFDCEEPVKPFEFELAIEAAQTA